MYLTRFFTIFTTVLSKPLRSAISRLLHHQYTCSTCPSNTCAVGSLCALCPGTEADACSKTIRCPSGDEPVNDTAKRFQRTTNVLFGTTRWDERNRQTRSYHYITHTFLYTLLTHTHNCPLKVSLTSTSLILLISNFIKFFKAVKTTGEFCPNGKIPDCHVTISVSVEFLKILFRIEL